jgi:hydroxymethylglutaryl-CoA reductase (NADPH)
LKDDYTQEAIADRHDFMKEKIGKAMNHVGRRSFDPSVLKGNIESFIGIMPRCLSELPGLCW